MQAYRTAATRLRHPVNVSLHTNAPLGVRIANDVTGFLGSWRFIIIQTIVVAIWVVGNIYLLFEHAAGESEDADKKDDDILARLTRIEALLTELAASKT
jgi:uncharacterized membrane protein